jgi:hypothetical protein
MDGWAGISLPRGVDPANLMEPRQGSRGDHAGTASISARGMVYRQWVRATAVPPSG